MAVQQRIDGSHLLLAMGRTPNVEDLQLEAVGVTQGKRGYIEVDDKLRTNLPHIYRAGRRERPRGVHPHHYNDYEIVSQNLLDGADRKVSDRLTAYALYIDPPLGRAGMSEAEALKSGKPVAQGDAADDAREPGQ